MRSERFALGLSQRRLARALSVGTNVVNEQSIRRLEEGNGVSPEVARIIAIAFRRRPEEVQPPNALANGGRRRAAADEPPETKP